MDQTERERAMLSVLLKALRSTALPQRVRDRVHLTYSLWSHLRRMEVHMTARDADARLAMLRAGLLRDLVPFAEPGGMPLEGLLSIGDESPAGWCLAVERALAQARMAAPGLARDTSRVPAVPATDWQRAAALLREDPNATTAAESRILFAGDVELRFVSLAGRLALGVKLNRGTSQFDWRHVSWGLWKSTAVLSTGLHAVSGGCDEGAHETLRRGLADLMDLVSATAAAETASSGARSAETIRAVVASLDPQYASAPLSWFEAEPFAFLWQALDMHSRAGTGLVVENPEPGTWIQLPDGRVGRVLDDAALHHGIRARLRGRSRGIVALVDGEPVPVKEGQARTPRRAHLFGMEDGLPGEES